ncbi:MAG: glycosyltransferase family 2 protein [Acidimicrobiales bacterium]
MPAHNEAGFLATAVHEVVENLRTGGKPFEVLIVENGSTDATAELARGLAAELSEVRAMSLDVPDYGGALRTGFVEAHGELVAVFDVDYYDFDFLDRGVGMIEAPGGPDVVVGSKRGAGAVDTRAWKRRMVTAVFSSILRYGFGLKVSDTHGIKVMRRAPLKDLAVVCHSGTDIFDTELILRAERQGLAVTAIPVTVEERRPSRSSIVKRIPRTLLGLAKLRVALWRDRKVGPTPV